MPSNSIQVVVVVVVEARSARAKTLLSRKAQVTRVESANEGVLAVERKLHEELMCVMDEALVMRHARLSTDNIFFVSVQIR